jgi:hypothetical protein
MNNTEYTNSQASQPGSPSAAIPEADRDLLMMDDLPYQEARDYVMQFLIVKKKTEAMLQEKQQKLNQWNERLAFAEQKGRTDLLEDAKRELRFLVEAKTKLTAELDALNRKIVVLKEKLDYKAKTAGIPLTTHAEQLLTNLDQLADVGEYKLKEAMKQQEAEDELAKLKAKLGMS